MRSRRALILPLSEDDAFIVKLGPKQIDVLDKLLQGWYCTRGLGKKGMQNFHATLRILEKKSISVSRTTEPDGEYHFYPKGYPVFIQFYRVEAIAILEPEN